MASRKYVIPNMRDTSRNLVSERPGPVVLESEPYHVHKKTDREFVVNALLSGSAALITDQYPTGLAVLAELKKRVFGENRKSGKKRKTVRKPKDDFLSYRKNRAEFRHASNNLLVPVADNTIALKKSPDIGWLKKLYPDISDFYLPFPQVQGLNSSWQWYIKGIQYPVLEEKLYPWYGTYFPTRFDHLLLFDRWLKAYQGPQNTALDVGTGCGVLAFQLIQNGFKDVCATDIHPNAILSVMENAANLGVENRLDVRLSDLFDGCDRKADLIVFNPPWLPADGEIHGLDKAIYYEPDLFERFFERAGNYLNSNGKIILFFSNLGRKEGMQQGHPIEEELSQNSRYRKCGFMKEEVAGASRNTRRRDHRKREYVELWELEKSGPG